MAPQESSPTSTTLSRYNHLKSIDFNHLWHPFTQTQVWLQDDPLIIAHAEGVTLIDVHGKRYLDGVSSLWCNVHGHQKKELVNALQKQAQELCHSTLLGLSHVPILELTEEIMRIMPKNLKRVFYTDSGSTAVEAALRMSIEWWQKQGKQEAKKKTKFASLLGGYHGDTLGAVAVGYLPQFHAPLEAILSPALRVSPPHFFRFYKGLNDEDALAQSVTELKELFEKHADQIAAFIFEPLVQGAAGIWIQPIQFLTEVASLCKKYEVLLIADEVATGFGKTGKMFAVEYGEVHPDFLVVGKGLSGGYLPISAVLTTEEIFDGFTGTPAELKTFFYGQTFCGNPLAASVSLANLKLFEKEELLSQVVTKGEHFHHELQEKITSLPHVDEVRFCGFMVGIEFTVSPGKRNPYPSSALLGNRVTREARKRGAIIRPLGNVMVLMPPLCMREEELSMLVDITKDAIVAVTGE